MTAQEYGKEDAERIDTNKKGKSVRGIPQTFRVSPKGKNSSQGTDTSEWGRMEWFAEGGIDSLVRKYREMNKTQPRLEGYRVQIFSGPRKKANRVKSEFLEAYPEIPAYNDWNPPVFRIRVGNFRTRLAAERCRHRIRKEFPRGYVVKCRIDLPGSQEKEKDREGDQ